MNYETCHIVVTCMFYVSLVCMCGLEQPVYFLYIFLFRKMSGVGFLALFALRVVFFFIAKVSSQYFDILPYSDSILFLPLCYESMLLFTKMKFYHVYICVAGFYCRNIRATNNQNGQQRVIETFSHRESFGNHYGTV